MSEQSINNKKEKIQVKKKQKIKPVPVMIAAVIIAALIGTGIFAAVSNGKKTEESTKATVALNQANLKPENATSPVSTVVTTIEILLEDTAIPVGTSIQVTAIVSPEDTKNALSWSSSNQDVFTVSKEGTLTITGTGTAALTATIGTVSDAVAIEGISSVKSGSVNQYPVYTGGSTGSGNVDESGSNGASDSLGEESDMGDSSDNHDGQDTNDSNEGNASGNQSSGDNTSSGNNNTAGGTGTSTVTSRGATSNTIGGSLPEYGFSQTMSNVYVCEENDVYYGEIVTQPNVTIIYVKQRTGAFDSKINSVLAQLLPDEYGQVWANYVSASTDRTFVSEGRRVRIVAASGGGHSQIVIYN